MMKFDRSMLFEVDFALEIVQLTLLLVMRKILKTLMKAMSLQQLKMNFVGNEFVKFVAVVEFSTSSLDKIGSE